MNPKAYACISAGGYVTGFIVSSVPYLQFLAFIITIAAGLKAFFSKPSPRK